ncbi:Crp/Fnr family transcriptional regulator [candidate division KSB1 bacterium]
MGARTIGSEYRTGDVIAHQGDEGNCMFVIQEGEVEIIRETENKNIRLIILNKGDFFGDVPFFERKGKSGGFIRATVKALSDVRVLTVDKKTFLRRIHEDPSLAYNILQVMSRRMQEMEDEVTRLIANGQ